MEKIFESFGINAQLLLAQVINFAVLLLVLYKFAYRPILRILDERREKIENSLKQAEAVEERTKKLEAEIAESRHKARKEADRVIAEAKSAGEKAKTEILFKASEEVTRMLEKAKTDTLNEKEAMLREVKDHIVKTSVVIVEKLLKDKLDPKTREALVLESIPS